MYGNKRFPSDKKDRQPLGKGCAEDSGIKRLQAPSWRIRECVRRVPDIRPEKVADMRSKVSSGSWNPASTKVADEILCEHLFDFAVF